MKTYELKPIYQKSFYGKAIVQVEDDGTETLYSYQTVIARKHPDGAIERLWGGWSQTTGKHIKAFCGLGKKEFCSLPHELTPLEQSQAYEGTLYR